MASIWRSELMIQSRLLDSISRTVTVVLGAQVSSFLRKYFTPGEVLLVLVVVHSLMSASYVSAGGFKATWLMLKGLVQSVLIQLSASYLTSFVSPVAGLLNVLAFLLVAECIPAAASWSKGVAADSGHPSRVEWIGDDEKLFVASMSYIFSDEVTGLLALLRVPLVCASAGLLFGGQGLMGRTLVLTSINALCLVVFGLVGGSEVSIAWPVTLLYFSHEVVGQFEAVQPFVDYGMYKASDSVYAGLVGLGVGTNVIAILFLFLAFFTYVLDQLVPVGVFVTWGFRRRPVFALSGDELWLGLCVLVMVRAATDWFLASVSLLIHCDPVLGGLSVVAAVHFVTLGVDLMVGGSLRSAQGASDSD